jgi:hypothetical protein
VATIATGEGGGTVAETIVQYSKGFLCGEAGGFISVYSKQDGEDINFKKVQKTCPFQVYWMDRFWEQGKNPFLQSIA